MMRKIMRRNFKLSNVNDIQKTWCCNETPLLFRERWEKLCRDFCDVKREAFEPSKVSELYDSLKYDILHNRKFLDGIFYSERPLVKELYVKSKILFDYIGPKEYGIEEKEKYEIGILSTSVLLKQIITNLTQDTDNPRTRLYFTKESKVICLLNVVLLCGLKTNLTSVANNSNWDFLASTISPVNANEFCELDCI